MHKCRQADRYGIWAIVKAPIMTNGPGNVDVSDVDNFGRVSLVLLGGGSCRVFLSPSPSPEYGDPRSSICNRRHRRSLFLQASAGSPPGTLVNRTTVVCMHACMQYLYLRVSPGQCTLD